MNTIRIYRYFTAERAIEALSCKRLYCPSKDQLNDVFDCSVIGRDIFDEVKYYYFICLLAYDLVQNNEKQIEQIKNEDLKILLYQLKQRINEVGKEISLREFKEKIEIPTLNTAKLKEWKVNLEQTRILCFSTDPKSQLMWAHYGESSRGIVLGFDVSLFDVDEVVYRHNIPKEAFFEYRWAQKLFEIDEVSESEVLKAQFCIKHPDWAYENEWRLLLNLEALNKEHENKYYMPLNRDSVMEIILGPSLKKEKEVECVDLVRSNFPSGVISKLKLEKFEYRFEATKIEL